MQFQQDWPKDEKITALSIFWWKTEKFHSTDHYGAAVEGSTIFLFRSSLGSTSMESCQLADLKYANMQFKQDWPKDTKITALSIFWWKTEKLRSTDHYGAPLEGSTIFLCRSSLSSAVMESCRLPELKYAIFSRAGRKAKKLPRSKLFLSMAFKHGLLEGSTFLFQYSCMTRARLESS